MVADLAEQSGRARSGFNATIYNDVKEGFQPLSAQPPVLIATAQSGACFASDPALVSLGPTSSSP